MEVHLGVAKDSGITDDDIDDIVVLVASVARSKPFAQFDEIRGSIV
jgi:hypothetical protein